MDYEWPKVDLEVGQVWVDHLLQQVFEITKVEQWTIDYTVQGHGPGKPYTTNRIQWELDVGMGKLVLGEKPTILRATFSPEEPREDGW